MTKKSIVHTGLIALFSCVVAVFGLGFSSYRDVTPATGWEFFSKIHPADGWVQQGSAIYPIKLAPRGNRMILEFNPWRPAGQPPAHLRANLCGNPVSEFVVNDASPITIYLTGECEPRTVSFDVLNPFRASAEDSRLLGAQLTRVRIESLLGAPIVAFPYIAAAAVGLFICALLVPLAFSHPAWRTFSPLLSIALWLPLLSNAQYVYMDKIIPVWLFICSLCIGAWLFRRTEQGENSKVLEISPVGEDSSLLTVYTGYALAAVALGGVIRFYMLNFGLPANYHPDEVPKVIAMMRMYTQDTFNPQYFLHPSFLLYSTYFMNTIVQWFGYPGTFQETGFLAGRIVSALGGTLSIYFIYVIGARLYSRYAGVVAAFVLAVLPLHVTGSRYLKEDAFLLAIVLAAVVAVLKGVREDKKRFVLLAGLIAGISASTKYSGILTIMVVVAAPWLRSGKLFKPDLAYLPVTLGAIALAPLGFVLCTPYSILDSTKFLHDFNFERSHMVRGHTIQLTAWSQYWTYHLWRSIIPGMSWIPTLVSLIGIGLIAKRRKMEDLYLICLILLFYLPAEYVKAKPAPQPERYIFPCLPFLALAIGELVRVLKARFRSPQLATLAIAIITIFPLYRTVQLAQGLTSDTREQMAEWMKQNIPHGSKVYVDWKPYEPTFPEGEFQITYLPRDKLVLRLAVHELQASDHDYLLLSSLWYGRYFNQPRSDLVAQRRVREIFERVPAVKQFDAPEASYGFHNPTVTLFSLNKSEFARLDEELSKKKDGKIEATTNDMRASFRW